MSVNIQPGAFLPGGGGGGGPPPLPAGGGGGGGPPPLGAGGGGGGGPPPPGAGGGGGGGAPEAASTQSPLGPASSALGFGFGGSADFSGIVAYVVGSRIFSREWRKFWHTIFPTATLSPETCTIAKCCINLSSNSQEINLREGQQSFSNKIGFYKPGSGFFFY